MEDVRGDDLGVGPRLAWRSDEVESIEIWTVEVAVGPTLYYLRVV